MNLSITANTISIALGVFFLLATIVQFFRVWKLIVKGVRTSAIIKDFVQSPPGFYTPMLEYHTKYGQIIIKKSYIGTKENQKKQIGDKVPVVYNPDKTDQFLLNTGMDKYWKIIGMLIAGIVFIVAGLLQLF